MLVIRSKTKPLPREVLKRGGYCLLAFVAFITSAELTARLDDWLQWGLPLVSTPAMQSELLVWNGRGWQGKPYGRFKHFALNEFGFRSPTMNERADAGVIRIVILGASETFGQRESRGKEYPAQLAGMLESHRRSRFEVINAALPGMTVRSMRDYWASWVSRFRPELVVIYPSTHLYLGDNVAESPATNEGGAKPDVPKLELALQSRFYERLRSLTPGFYRRWRNRQVIQAMTANKPPGWLFESLPEDRLQHLTNDLDCLVRAISSSGGKPILLTHAVRSAATLRPEDRDDLEAVRPFVPRATPETLLAFEQEANRRIVRLSIDAGIPVIDVAGTLSGRREWFVDLVHFSDQGAEVVARLLRDWIERRGKADAF
jgi:hypothetical protein